MRQTLAAESRKVTRVVQQIIHYSCNTPADKSIPNHATLRGFASRESAHLTTVSMAPQ